MPKAFISLLYCLCSIVSSAQVCTRSDLSKLYDYKLVVSVRATPDTLTAINRKITLLINKKGALKPFQEIQLEDQGYLFATAFIDCNTFRSFMTGAGQNREVIDHDYGDLVVADLNFDGKEDVALKYDSGGNGGPLYRFYTQRSGRFVLDRYLTNKVIHFPSNIDQRNKTITTTTHAGVKWESEAVYRYNDLKRSWSLAKRYIIKE